MKYKFVGYNTAKTVKYEYEGDTYKEIYYLLLDRGIVHGDILENIISDKFDLPNLSECDIDEIDDLGKKIWSMESQLEDRDYLEAISQCDGMAYYQEWYDENGNMI